MTRAWRGAWAAALLAGVVMRVPIVEGAASTVPSAVTIPAQALHELRRMAILHRGRVKPFDSFARETLWLLTGAPRVERQDPVATILSIAADPSAWTDARLLAVPFMPLRHALELDPRATHVSYNELVTTKRLMRMLPAIAAKQQRDEKLTMLEQETMDLFDRFVAFTGLMKQEFPVSPPASAADTEWRPVAQSSLKAPWEALLAALRAGTASSGEVTRLAARLRLAAVQRSPQAYPPAWRLALEVGYYRAAPFAVARLLYAIAALLLLLMGTGRSRGWGRAAGWGAFALALGWHIGGLLTRVVVGARPPVSNFYETMLWLPFVAVAVAAALEGVYRVGFFAASASVVAALTLWLADVVPLDPSIAPVVAVLRSNLWLTIHVLTVVASYGALSLAVILAHIYAVRYLARPRRHAILEALDLFLYRATQVGVVLLAAGIMLGAVWANASWGRYWGWDPKETWALITLLWFLAILHGRFAGWLRGIGVALSTITGFFLLLMTYYGVSFYLVGLHSYAGGHSTPVPPILLAYLAAETAFLLVVGFVALRRR